MDELRAELEQVLAEGPLTRDRLNKLVKMDSFLRESERYNNAGLCTYMSLPRLSLRPFHFLHLSRSPPSLSSFSLRLQPQ